MSGPNRGGDQARGGQRGAGQRDAPSGAQRPAERVMHDAPADRRVFREGDTGGPVDGFPDPLPYDDAEAALGGADTVAKTTYGSPLGAEPDGLRESTPVWQRKGHGTVTARVGAGGGVGPVAWLAVALALVAAVVYAAGVFG